MFLQKFEPEVRIWKSTLNQIRGGDLVGGGLSEAIKKQPKFHVRRKGNMKKRLLSAVLAGSMMLT
ncbi:MAG TPA: hypothetical protein H9666_09190, partial [Firmicutes bacterium]|nr:hypothetical protein [Bacillota bacterium]